MLHSTGRAHSTQCAMNFKIDKGKEDKSSQYIETIIYWAGEMVMVQWLRTYVDLAEDPSLVSNNHSKQLTTVYNPSFRSDILILKNTVLPCTTSQADLCT